MLEDLDFKNIKKRLGKDLKKINRMNKIGPNKLADLSGIGRTTIWRVENGLENVSIDHFLRYLIATDINLLEDFIKIIEAALKKRRDEEKEILKQSKYKRVKRIKP